jgi:hypothetical protein
MGLATVAWTPPRAAPTPGCRRSIVAGTLAMLFAASVSEAGDCATLRRPRMRVRLTVAADDVPHAAAAIREIVAATWRAEGLSFEWIEDQTGDDLWSGINAWIAVISDMPAAADGGVMGEVLFRDGVPRRLIRISIDATIAWVRRDQAARFGTTDRSLVQTLGDTAALVPRALGLIAAHEIGHFVLGSAEHAKSGRMQATYYHASSLLTRPGGLALDPGSRARLQSRLLKSSARQ